MASQDPTQLRVDSDSQTQRGILRVLSDWWTNGVAFPNAVSTPANGYVGGGDAAWIVVGSGGSAPAFQNSFANRGGALESTHFRKLPTGLVVVNIQTSGTGTSGTTAWTMPVGYRPAGTLVIPLSSSLAAVEYAVIDSSGNVGITYIVVGQGYFTYYAEQ